MNLLWLNKPRHVSSRRAANRLLRDLGYPKQTKWGFIGTLDPRAAGLLPICIDWQTKLIPYLETIFATKEYQACFALGEERYGDDASGPKVYDKQPLCATRIKRVLEHLPEFQSALLEMTFQVPPQLSAKRIEGKRAYKEARSGRSPYIPASPCRVLQATHHRSQAYEGDKSIRSWWTLKVSKGTYIRSIARILGVDFGIGAYLYYLRRLAMGPVSLSQLSFSQSPSGYRYAIYPLQQCMPWISDLSLTNENYRGIMNGKVHSVYVQKRLLNTQQHQRVEENLVWGRLTFEKRAFILVLKGDKSEIGQKKVYKYKILKRIAVSNIMGQRFE